MSPRAAALLALTALAGNALAAEVELTCTADNSVCSHPKERKHNMGGSERIKLKGGENILLLNFDAKGIAGHTVKRATLLLKNARKKPMLRLVGISAVATTWKEGKRPEQDDAQRGESCFNSPELGKRSWAGPGSDFHYAVFGQGGTLWKQVYIDSPGKDGWFRIPVAPRIVEALAAGHSHGIAVSCDNGEVNRIHKDVWPDTIHGNMYVFSRESKTPPRLVVELAKKRDNFVPGPVRNLKIEPWPAAATYKTGAMRVSWTASGDDGEKGRALFYRITVAPYPNSKTARLLARYITPVPPEAGQRVSVIVGGLGPSHYARTTVEVAAIDEGGNQARASVTGKPSAAREALPELATQQITIPEGAEPAVRGGLLRAWAFGDGLKVNPVNGNLLEEQGIAYGGKPAGRYRKANEVWDGAKGEIRLSAARGEWIAFQLCLEAVKGTLEGVQVSQLPLSGPDGREMAHTLKHKSISRAWYIKDGNSWYTDPLVPVSGKFSVPWKQNAVPDQKNQTIYVEFFVPQRFGPGHYESGISVSAKGVKAFTLPIRLRVLPFTIPKKAHFTWSMNAYSSPARSWGKPSSRDFLAAERDFYVKSHLHRTCLASLHYSQSGQLRDEATPAAVGSGKEMRTDDWKAFDARFGPLFDASAFAGTPRESVALDHFYLAFHENWPVPIDKGYKWYVKEWEKHWQIAGPIERGFTPGTQTAWKALLADYAKHIKARGWQTQFHLYLNNKFLWKMYGRHGKKRGRGSSFWLLDEPAYPRDFQALAFFGRLMREALGGRSQSIIYRVDISRPERQRDTLDGLVDLNICGNYTKYRSMVDDRRSRFGETVWTYGGLPQVNKSALSLSARAVSLYSRMVDGFVPWLVLGGEDAWTKPSRTVALYVGKPVGITGCVPSLRLKACRRGEQDVEYLWLLGQKLKLDRQGTADLGASVFTAAAKLKRLDPEGGAKYNAFEGLDFATMEKFRRTMGGKLTK